MDYGSMREIDGVAAKLAANLMAAHDPLDIATLSYDLLQFTPEDTENAISEWRSEQEGPSLVVDFTDPSNSEHLKMLYYSVALNIGTISWRLLESTDHDDRGRLLYGLGGALRVSFPSRPISDGLRANLVAVKNDTTALGLRLVKRLRTYDMKWPLAMLHGGYSEIPKGTINPAPGILSKVYRLLNSSKDSGRGARDHFGLS